MVVVDPDETAEDDAPVYWAVHAQYQRLIVYSPEPNWFIYIVRIIRFTTDDSASHSLATSRTPRMRRHQLSPRNLTRRRCRTTCSWTG